jgi:anti-sigma regulatory factor (Ser/Thr protein kinase)/anti-anti-sigma regulatory factor
MASSLLGGLVPAGALDDVAVVVVRLAPAPLEVHLAADPSRLGPLRRSVAAWAEQAGLRAEVLDDLQLALGEAATNAVEHAYGLVPPEGAGVDVRLTMRADGGVGVWVRDRGTWREAPRDPGHRGRGLLLIRAVASDVVVEGGPDGTAVTFTVGPGRHEAVDPDAGEAEQRAERPVQVVTKAVDGGHRAWVSGDLDLAGALEARRRLAPAERDGPWTLDVTGVGYLASAGVGLLLEAVEHGAELVLPEDGPAARVLALSGLTSQARLTSRSS